MNVIKKEKLYNKLIVINIIHNTMRNKLSRKELIMNEIKKDFPILENTNITYLDSGATTQKPIQVIKAVEEFYRKYNANPHRGAYTLSMEATEIYENTRTKIAKFINAKHREEIIFSKNATESFRK